MDVRLLLCIFAIVLLIPFGSSEVAELDLSSGEKFKQNIESCTGVCDTDDDLTIDSSSQGISFDTGRRGYCGSAGVRYDNTDLSNVDAIGFKAKVDSRDWAGATGLKINGDYKFKRDPSGDGISTQIEREIDISDIEDSDSTITFLVEDTSKEYCNMFDHSIEADYTEVYFRSSDNSDNSDESDNSDNSDSSEDAAVVNVKVVGKNDEPMSNVSVAIDDSGNDDYKNPRYTDREGEVTFYENTGPAPPNRLTVTVRGENTKSVDMNNGEEKTLRFEIANDEDRIEEIDFEVEPELITSSTSEGSLRVYDGSEQEIEVENADISVKKLDEDSSSSVTVQAGAEKVFQVNGEEITLGVNYVSGDSATIQVNGETKSVKETDRITSNSNITAREIIQTGPEGQGQVTFSKDEYTSIYETQIDLPSSGDGKVTNSEWYMGNGEYTFRLEFSKDGSSYADSEKVEIDLKDGNQTDNIQELNLDLSTTNISVGDTLKLSATDGEGEEVSEVNIDVIKEGEVISKDIYTELPVSNKFDQATMESVEWISDTGTYTFKASTVGEEDTVTDSVEAFFDTGEGNIGIDISVSPKTVSPGEDFNLQVKNGEGEEVTYDNVDLSIFKDGNLEYKSQSLDVFDSGTVEYPGTESALFHGYGSYSMEVQVQTADGNAMDAETWNVVRENTTDISVNELSRQNSTLSATIGLSGTKNISAQSSLKVIGGEVGPITEQLVLEEGQNQINYRLPDTSGTKTVSVRVTSDSADEEILENNVLQKEIDFSNDKKSLKLEEGWNMISSGSPISLTSIDDQCDINNYRERKFWMFSGGQWSHPKALAPQQGVMVNSNEECNPEVGIERTESTKTLSQGWNIISVSESTDLSSVSGDCSFNEFRGSKIYHYSAGEWSTFSSEQALDPSKGYYVNADSECSLELQNEPTTPSGEFVSSTTDMIGDLLG
jgi:hypothetical protein